MNSDSLIIDLRYLLPWHRRYVPYTSTAVLWAAWLLLWQPLLLLWAVMALKKGHGASNIINTMGISLEQSLTALIACAVALWLWQRFMPAQQARKPDSMLQSPLISQDYAQYFALPEQQVLQARQHKICVVHHDALGNIQAVLAVPVAPTVSAQSSSSRAA